MLLFSEDPAVMVLAGLNQVSAPPDVLYTCVRMYPSAGAGENRLSSGTGWSNQSSFLLFPDQRVGQPRGVNKCLNLLHATRGR